MIVNPRYFGYPPRYDDCYRQSEPIAVLLTGLIVLAACGDGDDPVVAEVGVVEIHALRLAQFVERLPEGMRGRS